MEAGRGGGVNTDSDLFQRLILDGCVHVSLDGAEALELRDWLTQNTSGQPLGLQCSRGLEVARKLRLELVAAIDEAKEPE